jgi:hypothetical protein
MEFVKLEIKNCSDCPHCKQERMFTSDPWETAENWFCTEPSIDEKKIQGYVEWHEVKNMEVPNWCPILIK